MGMVEWFFPERPKLGRIGITVFLLYPVVYLLTNDDSPSRRWFRSSSSRFSAVSSLVEIWRAAAASNPVTCARQTNAAFNGSTTGFLLLVLSQAITFCTLTLLNKGKLVQSFCRRMPFLTSTSRNYSPDLNGSLTTKTPEQGKGRHSLYLGSPTPVPKRMHSLGINGGELRGNQLGKCPLKRSVCVSALTLLVRRL